MKTLFAATVIAAALGAAGAQAQDWSSSAVQDLQAAHDVLRDNSPAPYVDRDSATFRTWLDAGLAKAQALPMGKINNSAAYAYALRYYLRGFHDDNIALLEGGQPLWFAVGFPGFSTGYRNGQYVVTWSDPAGKGLPPVGAVLVSCDKVPAEDLAQKRLGGFEGDLSLPSGRIRSAPYLLWDRANNMTGPMPEKCDFTVGRGKRTFSIGEQLPNDALQHTAFTSAGAKPEGLSIAPVGQGGYWISAHNLDATTGWDGFLAQVDQNLAAVQAAPFVILDLRGALEGDHRTGQRLTNRLWTPEYFLSKQPTTARVVYRTSQGNKQFYTDTVARLSSDPLTAAQAEPLQAILDKISDAMKAGKTTLDVVENTVPVAAVAQAAPPPSTATAADAAATAAAPPPPPPPSAAPLANPMKGRVLILVDSWCSMECLVLVDAVSAMPNVTVAGTPTSASSIFLGNVTAKTPSGRSYVLYGDKAWLDRPRASTPLTPQGPLAYTGDPGDEAAWKAFALQAVSQ
jgi:hypothetical protein